ncbi:hypothetical protein [Gordonia soli]|uniref:Uncharacterized protein n=1 Tax=Gordonia soli NBRC 108243 TaxID=1223545 RepID=M0QJS3_9ACTN|nr:hypothetical protein [Gordonia soli]GAC68531.1 hypothetical protein GS4_16_00610 [Gordonia soli NBRC 108243]
MDIRVDEDVVQVLDREDLRALRVTTSLDGPDTGERLRRRGLGYVDGGYAYVNAMWLKSLDSQPRWSAEVRELLSFADSRGWFDGVFLRVALVSRSSTVGEPIAS